MPSQFALFLALNENPCETQGSNLNVSLDFVLGNIEILGKQNSLFPRDQSLSVNYYMASSVSGQDKPNPALWLAGKIELSCLLLGLSAMACKKNSPESHITEYILYWPSLNCSVKRAGYWPHSFFLNLWTSTHNCTLSQSTNNAKKEKNLANIQPSWPHTWSITHTWYIASQNVLFL